MAGVVDLFGGDKNTVERVKTEEALAEQLIEGETTVEEALEAVAPRTHDRQSPLFARLLEEVFTLERSYERRVFREKDIMRAKEELLKLATVTMNLARRGEATG